jgi:hypothetical protein
MSMTDQIVPLPTPQSEVAEDGVIDIGDRTIRVKHHHMFAFDEYGTQPALTTTPTIEIAVEDAPLVDPIIRLEQKIDNVARAIKALNAKLDSIDEVLAKVICR